jgi:DNA-directed RNA polymerase subunit RPC12/RpoP
MAAEQHDKDYGYRTMVRVIVLISALMLVGAFIVPNVEYGPKVSPIGWVLITIWSVILVVGTIWASRVQRRYRCPRCRAQLPMLRPEASTKYQHRFHCPACDVIWTTDVYVGDT